MRVALIRNLCLVIGMSLIIFPATGCWWVTGPVPTISRPSGHRSFTGTFGHHKLGGPDAVREFNAQVKEWFMEQGFAVVEDRTYRDIVAPENWSKSVVGVLLVFKHNPQSLVYVFIPESYNPEDSIQNIGYHADWTGSIDELQKYDKDFNRLKNHFLKRFPQGNKETTAVTP